MSEVHEHSNRTVVSAEGMKKLEEQYKYLTTIRRAEVAEQISIARGFGDLSENAEYDAAKNEQSHLEAEIAELDAAIRTAIVVDDTEVRTDRVGIGTTVEVECVKSTDPDIFGKGDRETYTIVGARESDPMNNKISNESAIGGALLGKHKGDTAQINLSSAEVELKVLSIAAAK
jgi:transcription elongation factor GreA